MEIKYVRKRKLVRVAEFSFPYFRGATEHKDLPDTMEHLFTLAQSYNQKAANRATS